MDRYRLKQSSLSQLEQLYAESDHAEVPRGVYQGTHLVRVDSPGRRRPHHLATLSFQLVPFGVDFDTCAWFFFDQRLQIGRFSPVVQASRWRETTVVGLYYAESRLPGFLKGWLYDEVKPLSADLCLGLGGVQGERGVGDHFFFALQRLR